MPRLRIQEAPSLFCPRAFMNCTGSKYNFILMSSRIYRLSSERFTGTCSMHVRAYNFRVTQTQVFPPLRQYMSTRLHNITSHKTVFFGLFNMQRKHSSVHQPEYWQLVKDDMSPADIIVLYVTGWLDRVTRIVLKSALQVLMNINWSYVFGQDVHRHVPYPLWKAGIPFGSWSRLWMLNFSFKLLF